MKRIIVYLKGTGINLDKYENDIAVLLDGLRGGTIDLGGGAFGGGGATREDF